jgi:hypothetical protein
MSFFDVFSGTSNDFSYHVLVLILLRFTCKENDCTKLDTRRVLVHFDAWRNKLAAELDGLHPTPFFLICCM